MSSKPAEAPQEPAFSKVRAALWPVTRIEMKKFLPLSLMMSCVIFIYYVLRCNKDAGFITKASAEAVPFLKTFGVVPFSIIFFIIFSKMSNKLSKEKVFYMTIGAFLLFFASFAMVI